MPDDPEQYMRRVKQTIVGLVLFSVVVYWPVIGIDAGEVDPSLAAVPVLAAFGIVVYDSGLIEEEEVEEIGLHEPGTAWRATTVGKAARDGDLPINPGGGLKARGHPLGATGVSQLIELVWQLRGDLRDSRQVPGATTGFAINVAGFGNNGVCTILEAI
jgi:hypothetical protein